MAESMFCYPLRHYLTITQRFHSAHLGVDFGWNGRVANGNNQEIIAVADGVVVSAVDGYGNTYPNSRIYGNYVILSHGNGWYSLYGHLLKGLRVGKGDAVKQGQTLGQMGNTGYSNGQHLHFELRRGGNSKAHSVDPLNRLYVMPAVANPVVSAGTLLPERIRTAQTAKAYGTPVARDESKDQLEIVSSVVNARLYPTLSGSRWGYAARGIYNIHDRAEADGYVWYLLEPDVNGIGDALWVAYSPDWAALHLADTGSATLGSEIAQLRAQLKTAQAEVARLTKIVETVRAAVA